MMSALRHRMTFAKGCERGNATIELAFVAALLVPAMLGLFEFVSRIHQTMQLTHAVRAGSEYAVTYPSDLTGIQDAVVRASRIDPAGVAVAVTQFCECPDGSPIDCTGSCTPGGQPNTFIRVSATQPSKSPLGSEGFIAGSQVRAQAVLRVR